MPYKTQDEIKSAILYVYDEDTRISLWVKVKDIKVLKYTYEIRINDMHIIYEVSLEDINNILGNILSNGYRFYYDM